VRASDEFSKTYRLSAGDWSAHNAAIGADSRAAARAILVVRFVLGLSLAHRRKRQANHRGHRGHRGKPGVMRRRNGRNPILWSSL
jgi:hypothetical protein